jgi:hypothetical protein
MRLASLSCAAALALGVAARPAAAAPPVTGDYIEARSCNIYVGACHAQGEYVTAGRQAILAWKVREGSSNGVSLNGLGAIALVTADRNLGDPEAQRKTVLYLDASAGPAQRDAFEALLRQRSAAALGEVVAVKTTSIAIDRTSDQLQVDAPGVATLKAQMEPGQLCCRQKYQVWYDPFVAVKNAKIGYSVLDQFSEPTLKTAWSGSDQNNTYFGEFSF